MVPNVTVDDDIRINGNIVSRLRLSWGEPFNNLDPIVNYTVSCSSDGRCPSNFTTTGNSIVLSNLTPMTTYTFSVVATNSIGSGEAGVLMFTTPPGNFTTTTVLTNNTTTITMPSVGMANTSTSNLNTNTITSIVGMTNASSVTATTTSIVGMITTTSVVGMTTTTSSVGMTTTKSTVSMTTFISNKGITATTSNGGMTTTPSSEGIATTTTSVGMTTTTSSEGMKLRYMCLTISLGTIWWYITCIHVCDATYAYRTVGII